MPFKDGTGPLGQGSGMGRGQRKARMNKLQQGVTGWGCGQKPGNPVSATMQRGQRRKFTLTNQDEMPRPLGAGHRNGCRFRMVPNNPNI